MYFFTLEWSTSVLDIREQYPLLDGTEIVTLPIADKLGIKHPERFNIYKQKILPTVVTTDFLITAAQNGKVGDYPRTLKYEGDLSNTRVLEKLEIERQAYLLQGKELRLVTENDVDMMLAENVKRIHKYKDRTKLKIADPTLLTISEMLTSKVQRGTASLAQVALDLDENLGLVEGQCLAVAKHLIASRQWLIDMSQPFEPTQPLELIEVKLLDYTK